ncbi:MAG: hypothetical protein U9Q94_03355 [Candidatus Bipolaricaulota bacterium]|nr:hypothetical protein [Candidatus Bipolaricaulota bacterium]
MKKQDSLPAWSYSLVLALQGIVIVVGRLPTSLQIAVSVETVLFVAYLIIRSRRDTTQTQAVSNLLPLFPGHLLLLFALSIIPGQNTGLVALWMVIPATSVLYDLVSLRKRKLAPKQVSILTVLYCIIWADLFVLLERVVALGRDLHGASEIKLIVVFGVLAVVFLAAGVYRHVCAIKIVRSDKAWKE